MEVTVAGVPEHFNEPLKRAISDYMATIGRDVDLYWRDALGGTGQMREWLANNEVHAAVMLFEGAVKAINNGLPARILTSYVNSPLLWGVHVGANSRAEEMEEAKAFPLLISRPGSGSHLIPFVMADQKEWTGFNPELIEVSGLKGALEAVEENPDQLFFWEKYTTQPYVDQGHFRRLGTFPTPWPAFVIVLRQEYTHTDALTFAMNILERAEKYAQLIKQQAPHLINQMVEDYGIEERELEQWVKRTRWFSDKELEPKVEQVQNALLKLGLIEEPWEPEEYLTR